MKRCSWRWWSIMLILAHRPWAMASPDYVDLAMMMILQLWRLPVTELNMISTTWQLYRRMQIVLILQSPSPLSHSRTVLNNFGNRHTTAFHPCTCGVTTLRLQVLATNFPYNTCYLGAVAVWYLRSNRLSALAVFALVCVRWPRTGNPEACLLPR